MRDAQTHTGPDERATGRDNVSSPAPFPPDLREGIKET